jgi:hypothetical protein
MMKTRTLFATILVGAALSFWAEGSYPGRSQILYRGRLVSGGVGASETHDFVFSLHDHFETGSQVGPSVTSAKIVNGTIIDADISSSAASLPERSHRWPRPTKPGPGRHSPIAATAGSAHDAFRCNALC